MALTISQSATATGPRGPVSFGATGGTGAVIFSVVPGTAGGTINSSTGRYTGPAIPPSDPKFAFDTVVATDSLSASVSTQVLVGTPLILLGDIIQNGMGLGADQIWLWEQKINIPTDSRLYVAVSVQSCHPFSSINTMVDDQMGGLNQVQSVNMAATVNIDILSRGPAARDRKEEIVLALNSVYSEQQQEANSFAILRLSEKFINLSGIDGSAIPYRFQASFQMQYQVSITKPAPYFNTFQTTQVVTDTP